MGLLLSTRVRPRAILGATERCREKVDIVPTILEVARIRNDGLLLQGDSLVDLIYGRRLDFWRNRFVVSEEVANNQSRKARGRWSSLFFRDWHLIRSRSFGKKAKSSKEQPLQMFDIVGDRQEERPLRPFFQHYIEARFSNFIGSLQAENIRIWRHMTSPDPELIRYDPVVQERLRALGYLN